MLRFAEDDHPDPAGRRGRKFVGVPRWSLNYALAGVLMDLAMENRIDTDIENLMLIEPACGDSCSTRCWPR